MNCYFLTDFEFSFFSDSQTVTIILWYETWKWNGYELWYHSSFSTNCFDVFDSTAVLSRFVGSLIIGVDLDFISASNVVQ